MQIIAPDLEFAEDVEDIKDILANLIDDINAQLEEVSNPATGRGGGTADLTLSFSSGELAIVPALTRGVLFRISSVKAATIPGFAGGYGGRVVVLQNVSAASYTIAHESTTALDVERVTTRTGSALTLASGAGVVLVYDDATSRWIPVCTQL